jgi:23S rRNA pseudouridine2605 synthase
LGRQRLQKIIAAAGVTSRRKAEELVVAGRVAVNGTTVRELGASADPDRDLVTLDGRPLHAEPLRYFLAHKPAGVLCAVSDARGRPLVVELLDPSVGERLYPAGRLDLDSEGLVLLTNDGDLMQAVTRAGGPVAKMYEVTVRGVPPAAALDKLRGGAEIDGRRLRPCEIEPFTAPDAGGDGEADRRVARGGEPAAAGGRTAGVTAAAGKGRAPLSGWQVVLHEGKNNQIRKMFRGIGHPVQRLIRVAIGPLRLAGLPAGAVRELAPAEVEALRARTDADEPRTDAAER